MKTLFKCVIALVILYITVRVLLHYNWFLLYQ